MGKNSSPSLPATPVYQQLPEFTNGYKGLQEYGNRLITGDLTGNLSWLSPTISTSNTANSLSAAQGLLQPQFRDTLQQIRNEAAANNQLESSTFTDALARSQSDLNSQYQSIVSQQAIRDAEMANQNRLGLLGTGLGAYESGTRFAGQDQSEMNQFNLQNYDNQVAAALAGQKQANGGFLGGLMGAGGGALMGLALAPFTGGSSLLLAGGGALAGGLAGGLSPQSQNVGGSLLGSGAGLLGSSMGASALQNIFRSGASAPTPGAYASNAPSWNAMGNLNVPKGGSLQDILYN
jgi:hypothetical protein